MKPGDQIQYIGKDRVWIKGGEVFTLDRGERWKGEDGSVLHASKREIQSESFRPYPVEVPEYKAGDVIRVVRKVPGSPRSDILKIGMRFRLGTVIRINDTPPYQEARNLADVYKWTLTEHWLNPECFVIDEREDKTEPVLTESRISELVKFEGAKWPSPALPETEVTHAALFEFPNGERFEIPRPEGEGWTLEKRKEYRDKFEHWQDHVMGVRHLSGRLIFKEYAKRAYMENARCLWFERWTREVIITDEPEPGCYQKHWEFL